MAKMTHLMVDLETMGTNPNAPIVAIGAVFFDPMTGELGPDFYRIVTLKSELQMGAKPDAETIDWWLTQSDAARGAITSGERLHIVDALSQLTEFVTGYSSDSGLNRLQFWGNGASFDPVILRSAYARCNVPEFWKFWNDQDVRTVVALGRAIGFDPKRDHPFSGERHHALADAIHQAEYVAAIWQRLLVPHKNPLPASALRAVYAAAYNHGHLNTADGIAYQNDVESEFEHRALAVFAEESELQEVKC